MQSMKADRRLAVAGLSLGLVLALASGCSNAPDSAEASVEVSREAAAPMLAEPSFDASSEAASDTDNGPWTGAVGSSRLGVFTCVSNRTSADISVRWVWADTSEGNGAIAPGGHRCAEATNTLRQTLGVYVALPGAQRDVSWFFAGPQAYSNASRGARCFNVTQAQPVLNLDTCWKKSTSQPGTETVVMPANEGGYTFSAIQRPTDNHALGGRDTSGNRWHRYEISVSR